MDETILIETYRDTVHVLYRFVSLRCGGDRSLTEDVTQETWLRAVKAWRDQGLPESPMAWLKTVARNLLSNHFRRQRTISIEALRPGWTGDLSGDGGQDWEEPDRARLLSWGMARLRPPEAQLLEAFHLDGKAVAEIASEIGLSARAVEGRLRRARLKLRKQLEPVVRSLTREGGLR